MLAGVSFLVLTLLVAITGSAQGLPADPATSESVPPVATPLPALDIISRADQDAARLREVEAKLQADATVSNIQSALPGFSERFDQWWAARQRLLAETRSIQRLQDIRQEGRPYRSRINDWDNQLARGAQELAAQAEQLGQLEAVWKATAAASKGQKLPPTVTERVAAVLQQIGQVEVLLQEKQAELLTLQNQVSEKRAVVLNARDQVAQAEAELGEQLFVIDSPPFWRISFAPSAGGVLGAQVQEPDERFSTALDELVDTYGDRFPVHGTLFLALAFLLGFARRRMSQEGEGNGVEQSSAAHFLRHPVSTSFLVALLLTPLFYPQAPAVVVRFAAMMTVFPIVRLLPALLPARFHRAVYLLIVLSLLDFARGFAPEVDLVRRALLFALTAVALAGAVWIERSALDQDDPAQRRSPTVWFWAFRVLFVLLGLALVANVIGSVLLSDLLTTGTLRSAYQAVVFYASVRAVNALLLALLHTPLGRRLRIAREHGDLVARRLGALVGLGGAIVWTLSVLYTFRIYYRVLAAGESLLQQQWAIGSARVSPGDVAAFLITLLAAYVVSRLLRFLLQEEVFPRVQLGRGVPGAVSILVHYCLLLLGFLLALAAAGVDLSKVTLLASAFGVGVGFGLQSVVSNFASGLLLAFERPIQVGDVVEVGSVFGEVTRIGFRATMVRTYDGADVMIPNADLISKDVVNWSHSDRLRRVEVLVGVAYGTDPHLVIRTLLEVAGQHPNVLAAPAPMALFKQFGDSSLEFSLWCWTRVESFFRVRSEVTVGVNDAFEKAGIQIPFPQRDLHLHWPGQGPSGPSS
jgi:small-conductance mechanosensitive channel